MPQMYSPGEYDLGGFSVGVVRRENVLPKWEKINGGQVFIGLSASGVHSNGFSLVRKCLKREGLEFSSPCPWSASGVEESVATNLLTPTRIYVKSVMPLINEKKILSLAHITGGGLLENLNRALPDGFDAEITHHPKLSKVMKWLQASSGLGDEGMLRTFNCGVGMILIVDEEEVGGILNHFATDSECGEIDACVMGKVVKQEGEGGKPPRVIVDAITLE